jgi:hypothetical protein
VLASSMWLVLLGAAIGIGGAFVASDGHNHSCSVSEPRTGPRSCW